MNYVCKNGKKHFFTKIKITCRNAGHFCLYYCSLVIFLCKFLKTKNGNRKKTKRVRGVMEGTDEADELMRRRLKLQDCHHY